MKSFFHSFFFALLFFSCPLHCGNIKGNHFPEEHGKVKDEFARSVPSAYYRAGEDSSFAFSASYTLWVPYMNGINIANSNNPITPSTSLAAGNMIRPITSARSGFQLQAEKYLHYDHWRWCIGYMWFNNQNPLSNHSFKIDNHYSSPWISTPIATLLEASSSFSNQFNSILGTIDRSLAVTQTFIFTPFAGIIGGWETSSLNANLQLLDTFDDLQLFTMSNKLYWWCIGPYAGLEFSYRIMNKLSLFLKTASSLNLAKTDLYEQQSLLELTTPGSESVPNNHENHLWNIEPMTACQLGMKLNYKLKDLSLLLDLSWELQTWFHHMGFLSSGNLMGLRGNYSMQGLNASFGIIF